MGVFTPLASNIKEKNVPICMLVVSRVLCELGPRNPSAFCVKWPNCSGKGKTAHCFVSNWLTKWAEGFFRQDSLSTWFQPDCYHLDKRGDKILSICLFGDLKNRPMKGFEVACVLEQQLFENAVVWNQLGWPAERSEMSKLFWYFLVNGAF